MAATFTFTEEQEALRSSLRRFLEEKSPMKEVRRLMETKEGYDPEVWGQLHEQMGLPGLAIPEQYGGSGASFVELLVVFEELGRTLACVPYFSTVGLAANALLATEDEEAKKEYLGRIANEGVVATFALTEDSGKWDESGVQMEARQEGGQFKLYGSKCFVVDGFTASFFVVAARTEKGPNLFLVEGDAPGITRTSLATMDQTRKQARIEFDGTPARLVGEERNAWPEIERALDHAAIVLAAEQVGGAQVCLDMSVEYAKNRIQFGRPIGSFQAIKHKCADMLMQVESARSAAYYAAWCAAEGSDEVPVVAPLAKSYCSEAYFFCAAENIQIHGGIGFTWEHDAHLYFKRAKSSELMLGDPAYHRELLARRLGI